MKDKNRATITKRKDNVVIEISNNWFEHWCEEQKVFIESAADKYDLATLSEHFNIMFAMMAMPTALKSIGIGDKIHL